MIVVGIITIIVAIAMPTWMRQREITRAKACQENLMSIRNAKEVYALDFKLSNGFEVSGMDVLMKPGTATSGQGYLKAVPECQSGGTYEINPIGEDPVCSIGTTSSPFDPHVVPN